MHHFPLFDGDVSFQVTLFENLSIQPIEKLQNVFLLVNGHMPVLDKKQAVTLDISEALKMSPLIPLFQ